MRHRKFPLLLSLCLLLCSTTLGCSDDSNEGDPECNAGEVYNPVQGICEPGLRPGEDTGSSDAWDDTGSTDTSDDTGVDDTGSQDTSSQDIDDRNDTGECPDNDGDGYLDQACGGQDCDDNNPSKHPGLADICDAYDNDCSGEVNDGTQCMFYAQTSTNLYLVDPFEKTASPVTSVPGLFDMDTHPDGTLYGITSSSLYRFDDTNDSWNEVGGLGTPITTTPNGLAIDSRGTAYMTASNNVYTVDLATGSSTLIGSMGNGFNSSGDCVINKDDTLFMSSDHDISGDHLILIDTTDASGRDVGNTNFTEIYGLTAAWGRMFGLTGSGQLIEIDSSTGTGTLIHTFAGKSWYGAASTPNR